MKISNRPSAIGLDLYAIASNVVGQPNYNAELISQLGQIFSDENGNEYVLVLTGAAPIVDGVVVQKSPLLAGLTNLPVTNVSASIPLFASTPNNNPVITVTVSNVTENQLVGGYMNIVSGKGAGRRYGISSNSASVNGSVKLVLNDATPLNSTDPEYPDTTSIVTLSPNPYNGVITAPIALTGPIAGVSITNIPANSFAFILKQGEIPCLADSVIGVGNSITPSTTVAGAIKIAAAGNVIIGSTKTVTAANQYQPVVISV